MKTDVHLYLAQLFLECEVFSDTNVAQKIITHISSLITSPQKSRHLWNNIGKYGRAGQANTAG